MAWCSMQTWKPEATYDGHQLVYLTESNLSVTFFVP